MLTPENGAIRERVDFSKIRTSIPIPNLIEVQKKSYERFLQMELLPSERDDTGLESVFKSVFPISDFRGLSQLEFVDYAIGNWECKCGNLKGLHHLRSTCRNPACGATIQTDPFHSGEVLCQRWDTSWARLFPTAEAGWNSSTTTRTCCTSASIVSASSTGPYFSGLWD